MIGATGLAMMNNLPMNIFGANKIGEHSELGQASNALQRKSIATDTAAKPLNLRYRQVHLDFHTSELIEDVGKDFDAFDLICHVAFDQKPLTRRERATRVRKRDYFGSD